jgi:4-hydroxybenzoate polyprenyltransferase
VFVLASLYTVRIILGGTASGFFPSDWLLAFSCFFFLSLALVKRVAETNDLAGRGGTGVARRGYLASDSSILTTMGVSAGFIAALVLALYLQDDAVASRFKEPLLLWGLPAVGILWTCRIWLKATRGEMHDDPIVFAARDPWSWAMGAAAGLCFIAAATLQVDIFPDARDGGSRSPSLTAVGAPRA